SPEAFAVIKNGDQSASSSTSNSTQLNPPHNAPSVPESVMRGSPDGMNHGYIPPELFQIIAEYSSEDINDLLNFHEHCQDVRDATRKQVSKRLQNDLRSKNYDVRKQAVNLIIKLGLSDAAIQQALVEALIFESVDSQGYAKDLDFFTAIVNAL